MITRPDVAGVAPPLPLRLLLRFADAVYEQCFVKHYEAVYFRYAQVSVVMGLLLIVCNYLADRIVYGGTAGNLLRLMVAVPVLLAGLAYSMLPKSHRHWQLVMSSTNVAAAFCLFAILIRIDAEGGAGLKS